MRIEDIQRMAHDILEKGSIENDYIEYKKSATFKDKILKTIVSYRITCNNGNQRTLRNP